MKHVCAENPMRVIKKVDTEIGKGDKEERIEPRRDTDLHGDTTYIIFGRFSQQKRFKSVMDIPGSTIAVWGLSFKPKTDDIRAAPALAIINDLLSMDAVVHTYDPVAMDNAKELLKDVVFFDNPFETIRDCDALVVVTEWDEFRNPDMRAVKVHLKQSIIVDGRNIYDPVEMRELWFTYLGIGR